MSRPRLLQGLDPHKNIISNDTTDTIELPDDELPGKASTRLSTRPKRHSGTPVYDMKFHPMDAVTRPNSHITMRHRSNSKTFSKSETGSDDESELSDPPDSDDEADTSLDELSSDDPRFMIPSTPRKPDPRAVRHSARTEAQKPVNYSKKYHPQDQGIPGFQHKARRMQMTQPAPAASDGRKKRKVEITLRDDEEDAPRHPRKKLRSVDSNVRTARAEYNAKRKRGRPKNSKAVVQEDGDEFDEAEDLANWAVQSTQRQKLVTPPSETNQESEDADDLAAAAIDALPPKTTQTPLEIACSSSDAYDLPEDNSHGQEHDPLSYYVVSSSKTSSRRSSRNQTQPSQDESGLPFALERHTSHFDEQFSITDPSTEASDALTMFNSTQQ